MLVKKGIRVVLFDFDGVLGNFEEAAFPGDLDLFKQAGLDFDLPQFIDFVSGLGLKEIVAKMHDAFKSRNINFPDTLMDELQAHHKYIEQHEMRVIEGVPDLLASLSNAGIPFGVASNSSLGSLKNKLNLLGLYPLFEPHIFSKDMVSNPKPAPDLFLHAGRTMLGDDFDPACCAVVEDSIPGATAGVAAHMHVFGYAGGTHRLKNYDQELLQVGVKQAFHSMRDIQREIHILNLAMQAGAGMALKVGPLPSGP